MVHRRSEVALPQTLGRKPQAPRPVSAVLRLQRTAGNRALGQLMRRGTAPAGGGAVRQRPRNAVLARYDTGEHALFGDDTVVYDKDGLQITESEMITMGDLYDSPADLYQADPKELRTLVELIRRDKNAYLGVKGAGHVSDSEWESATPHGAHRKKTYLELAEDNSTHFGPRRRMDWDWHTARDHKAEWRRIHKEALDIAHGAKTPTELQRAYAYNAFAGHFLTDAFAAGHLISKDDAIERAQHSWNTLVTQFTVFHENEFTRKVAEAVLADPVAGKQLRKYHIRIAEWQKMSAEALSELLWQFANKDEYREKFYDNFVKGVHDELNTTGVEVDNPRHDGPWTIRGDGHLLPDDPWAVSAEKYQASQASSSETLKVGRAAIAASAANVLAASKTPGTIDYELMFDRVWAYVPLPTGKGEQHLSEVMDRLLDLKRPETVKAFAAVMIDHIDLLIRKLNDPSVDRLEGDDQLKGGPGQPM